jgi:serine/threonine protein kinase
VSESARLARLAARDGYQVVGEIGRGPRSTVYHALSGPLRQPVALKVFPAGTCTREEWEGRLRRGAELWAALVHPHIVPVQGAGWWEGAPYVALEYVPHGSLAAKLTGEPGSLRQALRLVEQLTEIVSYVHRQGVVHGNLKPSNVLFAADGIPRLVDFHPTGGLFQGRDNTSPRAAGAEQSASREWPADDTAPASVGYLAPELLREPGAEPRPYTDVYGLGLILYELLTGRPPFAAASAREMAAQVCSQEPVLPSRLNSEVTPHLEAFCLRCLRRNPWRRYARTYDVLTRLRYFQDNLEGRTVPGKRSKPSPPGRENSPRAN